MAVIESVSEDNKYIVMGIQFCYACDSGGLNFKFILNTETNKTANLGKVKVNMIDIENNQVKFQALTPAEFEANCNYFVEDCTYTPPQPIGDELFIALP